jgi:DNA-binding NtrC family response regulator
MPGSFVPEEARIDMHTKSELDNHGRTPINRRAAGPPVVYLAEDDDDVRESLTALFSHDGFEVRAAPDGTLLFEWLFRKRGPGMPLPDVIVTDHRMPGYCSLDILECLSEIQCKIPVIVITAYGSEVRSMALANGAHEVFEKPFDPDDLRMAVLDCIDWGACRPLPEREEAAGRALGAMARQAIASSVEGSERPSDV